ncbi:MAG: hypothetical protein HFI38_13900 [Lachnospiraceae bacterium]|jgi:hypothetical protein|nr:hypothetical protein [Lachnospiraceae bacterium]
MWNNSTKTTNKYGSSRTTVDGNSYVAFEPVYNYETGVSTLYFYSVYMSRGEQSLIHSRINDTWDYMEDQTGAVAPPEPVEVKGTWTKMDAQLERYYREALADMGVVGDDETTVMHFYTLDTGKIGGQSTIFFWVLMGAALLLTIFFVFSMIGIFSSGYLANINKYLREDSSASMSAIEADFEQAHAVGGDAWIGRNWTIYVSGPKAYILPNKDLVWGYYFRRTGRNSVSEMRLYTREKKLYHIGMSESETKEALGYYAGEQPHMIVGYDAQLEKLYQKNFQEFLNVKYNSAAKN